MDDRVAIGRFGGKRLRACVVAVACLLGLFLLLPLLVIFPTSVSEEPFLSFPPEGFSSRWYEEVLEDPVWRDAVWYSVRVALASSCLATFVGTCAALGLRRLSRGGRALRTLFIAPMVLPYVVYAFGLYQVFDTLRLIGSWWPLVVGQACLAYPIVFVAVSARLGSIDPALFRASASLGAAWPTTVRRIELPLIKGSIAAGFIFSFAFSFDELVVALFIGGAEQVTLPVQIFRSTEESASPEIAAISTLVTVLALVVIGCSVVGLRRGARRKRTVG